MDDDDDINSPRHYTQGGYESIEMIEDQGHGEGFCYGNALKYIHRARFKGEEQKDLEKAMWYLARRIKQLDTEPTSEWTHVGATRAAGELKWTTHEDGNIIEDPSGLKARGFTQAEIEEVYEEKDLDARIAVYDHIENRITYEEAMTDPYLCPFIDVEGYVHGTQCGCASGSVLDPLVANWPPTRIPAPHDDHAGTWPLTEAADRLDEVGYTDLPGATTPPETFVDTTSSFINLTFWHAVERSPKAKS